MNKNQFSQHFIDTIVNDKQFDFNDFKTREEFNTFQKELKEFNENPSSEKYMDLLLKKVDTTNSLYDHFRLKITAKPVVFHNSTLRNHITQSLWKKIRLEVLDKQGCKCSICDFEPELHEVRFLHVHEVENYDFENGIVELADLNLICMKCHSFQHMGRTQKVATKEQMDDLIRHFMEVNDCDYIDYKSYYLESLVENIDRVLGKATFDKVKFRVTGDIPYKEDVINQLTEKGIYSGLQRIIKVYKKEGIWNVDYNGSISIRTISKSIALEEARKLIPWNDHQTIIGVYNVNGNLMKTYSK